ncbi:hypothetical protein EVG20_g11317 [Dentipellis fragilis]|uniref:Uncharacterized protein n=1 Tax=Dentipellis fragilis TaxID=205917 RepID=A0A4Y9XN71_9AGAM|nr:hypothetical protein EVG20_g11317 [Dentipellis fragilis]
MIPSPTSRMKPPELKYGWRIGEKKLWALIKSQFPDAIQLSMSPELDDDGNEPDLPIEEFSRLHPDIDATFFSKALIDSILKYLDIPITKTSRSTVSVDYLCDSQGHPDIGLTVSSTWVGKVLDEPSYCKIKALISPNEDAQWYLSYYHWQWERQVPKQAPKPKAAQKASTAVAAATATASGQQ